MEGVAVEQLGLPHTYRDPNALLSPYSTTPAKRIVRPRRRQAWLEAWRLLPEKIRTALLAAQEACARVEHTLRIDLRHGDACVRRFPDETEAAIEASGGKRSVEPTGTESATGRACKALRAAGFAESQYKVSVRIDGERIARYRTQLLWVHDAAAAAERAKKPARKAGAKKAKAAPAEPAPRPADELAARVVAATKAGDAWGAIDVWNEALASKLTEKELEALRSGVTWAVKKVANADEAAPVAARSSGRTVLLALDRDRMWRCVWWGDTRKLAKEMWASLQLEVDGGQWIQVARFERAETGAPQVLTGSYPEQMGDPPKKTRGKKVPAPEVTPATPAEPTVAQRASAERFRELTVTAKDLSEARALEKWLACAAPGPEFGPLAQGLQEQLAARIAELQPAQTPSAPVEEQADEPLMLDRHDELVCLMIPEKVWDKLDWRDRNALQEAVAPLKLSWSLHMGAYVTHPLRRSWVSGTNVYGVASRADIASSVSEIHVGMIAGMRPPCFLAVHPWKATPAQEQLRKELSKLGLKPRVQAGEILTTEPTATPMTAAFLAAKDLGITVEVFYQAGAGRQGVLAWLDGAPPPPEPERKPRAKKPATHVRLCIAWQDWRALSEEVLGELCNPLVGEQYAAVGWERSPGTSENAPLWSSPLERALADHLRAKLAELGVAFQEADHHEPRGRKAKSGA